MVSLDCWVSSIILLASQILTCCFSFIDLPPMENGEMDDIITSISPTLFEDFTTLIN